MGDFGPIIGFAIIVALVVTALAVAASGVIYVVTKPIIIVPLLALIGFFIWRGYKKRRV